MATEIYELVTSGTLAGQFVQTVLHLSLDIPSPENPYVSAQQIAVEWLDVGGPNDLWNLALPASYLQTSLRVRRVAPSGGATHISLSGVFSTAEGQRDEEISSAQVNPLLIWIGEDNPSKTGRVFLPGVAEADIDNMSLAGGLLTAMGNFAAAFITGVSPAVGHAVGCIYRRTLGVGDIVNHAYSSPLIGTQRRRLHPV